MWLIEVVCSDPGCAEEGELVVERLAEADRDVCACGCCTVTLAVAGFEPLFATGELVDAAPAPGG